jgi:hypothetical protein
MVHRFPSSHHNFEVEDLSLTNIGYMSSYMPWDLFLGLGITMNNPRDILKVDTWFMSTLVLPFPILVKLPITTTTMMVIK